MPKRFPIGIIRCVLGQPTIAEPRTASYQRVIGPQGASSSLARWVAATFGYLDIRGTQVIPRVFRVNPSEVLGEPEVDDAGEVVSYNMDRRKMGDRAVELAADAGVDTDAFEGIVVMVRQGDLRLNRRPVNRFGGGASSLSDGRNVCILPIEASLSRISHEIGHVLGYDHTWGLPSRAWGWNDPPWDLTLEYGDPFCVMSEVLVTGQLDFLSAAPPASDWPIATFGNAGCAPALAIVHRTMPAALTENRCVRRFTYEEWHGGTRVAQIFSAGDQNPDRTKLVILEGRGSNPEGDPAGTFYVEYRPGSGFDQAFVVDPAFQAETCPAVVIHELKPTSYCAQEDEDNRNDPACIQSDGTRRRRGRLHDVGLKLHYRARIPVPSPLSRDWHAAGAPHIRIEEVATDASYVVVSIGAPVPNSYRALVPLGLPESVETRTTRVGGREHMATLCDPKGRNYSFEIQDVSTRLTLQAEVKGYGIGTGPRGDGPALSWTIEGSRIDAPQAGDLPATGTVSVTASTERYQQTTRPTRSNRSVQLQYEAHADGRLVLSNRPADGNYAVMVEASAVDRNGPESTNRRSERQVIVRGTALVWEPAHRRAVRGCLDRLLERARDIQREQPWIIRNPPGPGPYFLDDEDRVILGRSVEAFRRLSKTDSVRAKQISDLIRNGLRQDVRRLSG